MNRKQKFLLPIFLLLAVFSFAQNGQGESGLQSETYFSFLIQSKSELQTITKLISIDNVRGDTVWAYANMQQFIGFSRLGYSITLLPNPGSSTIEAMADFVVAGTKNPLSSYPSYSAYENLMYQYQSLYPSVCQLHTIATLGSGRKILVAKISDNVVTDETEPEFLYTSSIHGDETTGYILMLDLMDYILTNYGVNPEITDLVNNMEIYINPLANPDGTYYGGNSTIGGARRGNANNIDLNRNYPDPLKGQHPDAYPWQPETVAFMDFAASRHFVASSNFHGGEEVVNYPWDTQATLAADDEWWQYVSQAYVDTARTHGNANYMTHYNQSGITNGFAWYEIGGGRQDYMNYMHHCREHTIELSVTKKLPATQLLTYWNYNYRSLVLYMKQAMYGIHGIITDSVTALPLAAKVFVTNHDTFNSETYSSATLGDYSRLIKAGTYTLQYSAPNYQTKTIANVEVIDNQTVNINQQLAPNQVITLPPNTVTQNTAMSGGTINLGAANNISARGVCWSTSVNPTTDGNHTLNGSGTGTFTSQVTGLAFATLYHIRAYAVIDGSTVYGDDFTFTTSSGTINSFPWTEGFENGGYNPACWGTEKVGTSTIDWICISANLSNAPHSGTFYACLKDFDTLDTKTKLITPSLNTAMLINPVLKFWHVQAKYSSQDKLVVYYKTSANAAWQVLATYTSELTSWTQETINLPNGSTDYFIAFEGNAKYGYGVSIDDVSVTGTLKTLSVSPQNQNVSSFSGNTVFNVVSNSNWSVGSNQPWCTVPANGSGNAQITVEYTQNLSATPRFAEITIAVAGLQPLIVSVSQDAAPDKVLALTLFLEGLFNGVNMDKSKNGSGDQFGGQIADQILVELHHAVFPYALAAGPFIADLTTEGLATITVPASYDENYYIVIKHRNSIETWSAAAVPFSTDTINYNFSDASTQAYGSNLKQVGGKCLLLASDVNQDGNIDSEDLIAIDNAASIFDTGYLNPDVNGDGLVNADDIFLAATNALLFVSKKSPQ